MSTYLLLPGLIQLYQQYLISFLLLVNERARRNIHSGGISRGASGSLGKFIRSQFSNPSRVAVFCNSKSSLNSKSKSEDSNKNDSRDSSPNVLPTLFVKMEEHSSRRSLHDDVNDNSTDLDSDKCLVKQCQASRNSSFTLYEKYDNVSVRFDGGNQSENRTLFNPVSFIRNIRGTYDKFYGKIRYNTLTHDIRDI